MRTYSLVVLSYGSETEYRRALFTVLSFYALQNNASDAAPAFLATDKPEWFRQYLDGFPVVYYPVNKAKLQAMRGDIDFIHRIKISVIEAAFAQMQTDILYADSDTFFLEDPNSYMQKVDAEHAFMHVREYDFASIRTAKPSMGKSYTDFLELIQKQDFTLHNGQRFAVTEAHSSWNAGVMLLHSTHAALLPDVYALTDQFYPPTQSHVAEQYAFSVLLQSKLHLAPCSSMVYHYWHRVKKQVVDTILLNLLSGDFENSSAESKRVKVRQLVPVLYNRLENHPLINKDFAMQKFKDNDFKAGLKLGVKYALKRPFDFTFYKDVLRQLGKSRSGVTH